VSLRNDFIIPTRTSTADVLANGTQSGEFNDQFSLAISRNWKRAITMAGNFGVRFTKDPTDAGLHLLTQADQLRIGAGFILLPRSRVQFMNEYNTIVFVGEHTPNSSSGPRDPVDGIWGLRLFPSAKANLGMDIGYRYMLNLSNAQDRNGFVIKLGYAKYSAPPAPPLANRPPSASCSANPNSIIAGSDDAVDITATTSDPDNDSLSYIWTVSGGMIQGSGTQVRWVPQNLGAGDYRVDMIVNDGRGGTAGCTVNVHVNARPNRAPTVTLTADRASVLVGERVAFRANCTDPDGDMPSYTWRANGGQIVGNGGNIQLDTTGLNPGNYAVTVRCEDGRGGAADANASVQVQAPPPPPLATKLSQCDFKLANGARVDNVCKRLLDDVALRLQNEPRATIVIVGFADPRERRPDQLANTRATNAANYLATTKGIDRSRMNMRIGAGQSGAGAANRHLDIIWVPEGASY
jgi:outer membrane protein OmpA-like peptidoglycan-associated protein